MSRATGRRRCARGRRRRAHAVRSGHARMAQFTSRGYRRRLLAALSHRRAVVNDPQQAAFAIISDPELTPPFDAFVLGTPDYPGRSATLILQIESFDDGRPLTFRGPGIQGSDRFSSPSRTTRLPAAACRQSRAVPARRRSLSVQRRPHLRPAAHHLAGGLIDVCRGQGRRARDRQFAPPARRRRGAATRHAGAHAAADPSS